MTIPDTAAGEQTSLNVGKTLREAREALGMSVHDIAERTKFAPRQVEALEANDFSSLPTATFLRGFVRSYARVLQIDEASLLASLPGVPVPQPQPEVAAAEKQVDVAFPSIIALQRVNLMWVAGAAGVILLLVLFTWLGGGESQQPSVRAEVEAVPLPGTEAASAVAPAPASESAESAKVDEPAKPVEPPKVVTPPKAVTSPKAEAKPQPKPVEPEKKVNSVPPKPVQQEHAASKPKAAEPVPVASAESKPAVPTEMLKRRPLHFVFSGSAWIEVIDVNGDVLLSRTNQPGTEKWIGGPKRAPYDISIGHPGNVKLYYKGREIDLSAYAGMETARIKVE